MFDTFVSLAIIAFCAPSLVFWSVVTTKLIRSEIPTEG